MKKEEWKDIPEYEGYYQVSNLGRVRSLDRTVKGVNNSDRFLKGKIKPLQNHPEGYYQLRLSKDGKSKTFKNYQLVAMAFLNHKPKKGYDIDHIDNNKKNNCLENLQVVTHKENTRKDKKHIGVSYHKRTNGWRCYKYVNNKQVHLKHFKTKEEALNFMGYGIR